MGWTGCHREKGMSHREFFEQEFPLGLGRDGTVLDSATIGHTWYAAVQDKADGNVWALVIIFQWSRDWSNFTYKEMDETMGPLEDRCPARILDRLSPTEHEYALQWRERCRLYQAHRARLAKIEKGDALDFDGRCTLYGEPITRATLVDKKRNTWSVELTDEDGFVSHHLCRFPDWRDHAVLPELVAA